MVSLSSAPFPEGSDIETTHTRTNSTFGIAGAEGNIIEAIQITLALQDASLGSAGTVCSGYHSDKQTSTPCPPSVLSRLKLRDMRPALL